MGEQLHFSMDGEFLTAIARDWFWNMDKPYKKCEELLLSCMISDAMSRLPMVRPMILPVHRWHS